MGAKKVNNTLVVEKNLKVEGDAEIGNGASDKIGFYGKTPVDQPDAVASVTLPNASNNAGAINSILVRLRELGLIAE